MAIQLICLETTVVRLLTSLSLLPARPRGYSLAMRKNSPGKEQLRFVNLCRRSHIEHTYKCGYESCGPLYCKFEGSNGHLGNGIDMDHLTRIAGEVLRHGHLALWKRRSRYAEC